MSEDEDLTEEVTEYMRPLLLAGFDVQKVLEMGYEYACDLHAAPEEDEEAWRDACQEGAQMVLEAAKALHIDKVSRLVAEQASSRSQG